MEISIQKYKPELKVQWDDFVTRSKNGTFLHYRDFMEYHSERFEDCSLIFYHKNKIAALLPANVSDNTFYSHQGLTYAGLILGDTATAKITLDIFQKLNEYLMDLGISRFIYKPVPHIYHRIPSEEDLYALYVNHGKLIGRSISSCILQNDKINYSSLRKRGINKAIKNNLRISENSSFSSFWKILTENLNRKFQVSPVHSQNEIEYLKSKFPDNIHLFEVFKENEVVAGCVMFETEKVAHVQYISANEEGKETGALDYLFDYLIQKRFAHKTYFEFGISTEQNGTVLNEGLISQKEGFGGRGIVYDIYQLEFNTNK